MTSPRPSLFCSSPVLPPIITNEKDRQFLTELNDWTQCEISKINEQDSEQCYAVHREVFSRIIDYVSAYRPLMTDIKAHYEEIINILSRGKREAFFLQGKLSEMVNAPSTLRNYERRAEDLDTKLTIIQKDNDRLREQCNALKLLREERESHSKLSKSLSSQQKGDEKFGKEARSIPGLTLEQATNVETLRCELEKLDRQFRELSIGSRTRYLPREDRDKLKVELSNRTAERDRLQSDVERLRRLESLMRVAVESAQVYLKIQLPHQTIGDAILLALSRAAAEANDDHRATDVDMASRGFSLNVDGSEDSMDSDSVDDRDADAMLYYIEQFNELMDDKRYYDAAVHAANGPRGILRTQDTMQRFADLPNTWRSSDTVTADPPSTSPLLAFCSALMSTVPAFRTKPDESMSRDCVQCALDENRLDLVSHWLSQNRLKLSEAMGDLIYNYRSGTVTAEVSVDEPRLMLAQKIYVDVRAHVSALVCMASRGRTSAALNYATKNGCRMAELVEALNRCPRREFADALYVNRDSRGRGFLPLGVIVSTMIRADACEDGIELVKRIYDEGVSAAVVGCQSGTGKRYPFHVAINEDEVTTAEDWDQVACLCCERGYSDCASELLASVFAVFAVRKAVGQALLEIEAREEASVEQTQLPADSSAPDEAVSLAPEDGAYSFM